MKIGRRCTVCGDRIDSGALTDCEQCGQQVHEHCVEYVQKYECTRCADEPEIGALDF